MLIPFLVIYLTFSTSEITSQICNYEISPCIIGHVKVNDFRCGNIVNKSETVAIPRIEMPDAKEVKNSKVSFQMFFLCLISLSSSSNV